MSRSLHPGLLAAVGLMSGAVTGALVLTAAAGILGHADSRTHAAGAGTPSTRTPSTRTAFANGSEADPPTGPMTGAVCDRIQHAADGLLTASGDCVVQGRDVRLAAESVHYDPVSNTAWAEGSVRWIAADGTLHSADSVTLKGQARQAVAALLPADPAPATTVPEMIPSATIAPATTPPATIPPAFAGSAPDELRNEESAPSAHRPQTGPGLARAHAPEPDWTARRREPPIPQTVAIGPDRGTVRAAGADAGSVRGRWPSRLPVIDGTRVKCGAVRSDGGLLVGEDGCVALASGYGVRADRFLVDPSVGTVRADGNAVWWGGDGRPSRLDGAMLADPLAGAVRTHLLDRAGSASTAELGLVGDRQQAMAAPRRTASGHGAKSRAGAGQAGAGQAAPVQSGTGWGDVERVGSTSGYRAGPQPRGARSDLSPSLQLAQTSRAMAGSAVPPRSPAATGSAAADLGSLARAIAAAVRRSPNEAVIERRLGAARSLVEAAERGRFNPNLDGIGRVSYDAGGLTRRGSERGEDGGSLGWGVGVRMALDIYDGGAAAAETSVARARTADILADRLASQATLADVMRVVYWDHRLAVAFRGTLERYREPIAQWGQVVNRLFADQYATHATVVLASQLVLDLDRKIRSADRAIQIYRTVWQELTGVAGPSVAAANWPELPAPPEVGALRAAIDGSVEVQRARAALGADQAALERAEVDGRPTVSVEGESLVGREASVNGFVGMRVAVPLYDNGVGTQRIGAHRQSVAGSELALDAAAQELSQSVQQDLLALLDREADIADALSSLVLAESRLRQQDLISRNLRSDPWQVLQAYQSVIGAIERRQAASSSYVHAHSALLRRVSAVGAAL